LHRLDRIDGAGRRHRRGDRAAIDRRRDELRPGVAVGAAEHPPAARSDEERGKDERNPSHGAAHDGSEAVGVNVEG